MSRKKKQGRTDRQAPAPSPDSAARTRTWSFWLFVIVVPLGVAAIALYVSWRGRSADRGPLPAVGSSFHDSSKTHLAQGDRDDTSPDSAVQTPAKDETPDTVGVDAVTESTAGPANADAPLTDEEQEKSLRREQIDAVLQLVRMFPDDQNAIYLLGLVYQEQGNSDEALAQWERCRKLNPTRADLYNSMGQAYFLKGDLDQAAEKFRTALTLRPNLFEARVRLAEALNRQGKIADVVATLGERLPDEAESDNAASQNQDQRSEGAADTETVIQTIEHERAYLLLGQAYQQLKEFDKAKQTFLKASETYPESAEAHYGLARVCATLKQADEAKSHQERFRQLEAQKQARGRNVRRDFDPLQVTRQSVAHTHTDVGRVYQRRGDLLRAEQYWRRAAEVDPADSASRTYLAEMYHRIGQPSEALTFYKQLARIEPTRGVHYFHIGNVNLLLKRLDAAEVAYLKTIELEPNRADGYRALAQFYLVTRRKLSDAIPLARRALQLSPTAPVYALLGDLYDQTGDLEGALTAMQQAARLEPDNARYRSRYQTLQRRKSEDD